MLYLAYLGLPNMVKWGIPEKILRNAVKSRWPCVNKNPQSKVLAKSSKNFIVATQIDLLVHSAGFVCGIFSTAGALVVITV